ncbi:hypothetical protein [Actinoplanes sp. N902-109]|uniref:hypothetical protein n=1 Tax=Actinoplanes sp. (strain N902-109) TaxID=649831 RepID=UPI0005A15EBB|nr:hypothetical protein [Actinoplanes sp. N902-109]
MSRQTRWPTLIARSRTSAGSGSTSPGSCAFTPSGVKVSPVAPRARHNRWVAAVRAVGTSATKAIPLTPGSRSASMPSVISSKSVRVRALSAATARAMSVSVSP